MMDWKNPHALKDCWEHRGDTKGQPGIYPNKHILPPDLACERARARVCVCVCVIEA